MTADGLTRVRANGIGIATAAASVALALPNGGYYQRATAIAALVVWWIVLVGCASGALPRQRLSRAALVAIALLAALAGWAALSLLWSQDAGAGMVDVVRIIGYAGLAAALLLSFGPGFARQLLGGLTAGLTVVVAIGLISRFFPDLFTTERVEIADRLATASGRLSFPLGYWNALAGLAALDILLLLGLAVSAPVRWARASAGGLIALPVLVIFLTSSRGGVICAAVGVIVILLFADRRERWVGAAAPPLVAGLALIFAANSRQGFVDDLANSAAASEGRTMLVLTLAAVVLASLVGYALDPSIRRLRLPRLRVRYAVAALAVVAVIGAVAVDLPARIDAFRAVPDHSGSTGGAGHLLSGDSSGRWQYWSTAADAFSDQPLKGIGAGGYPAFWDKHGAIAAPLQNAHSLPLETLAEMGLVGGLLLLGAAAIPVLEALRRLRSERPTELVLSLALIAGVASQALIDWTWQVPAVFSIAIVAAAIILGTPPEAGAEPRRARGRRGLVLPAVAVVAALVAIGSAGLQLLGQTKIDSARSALADGAYSRALDDANGGASIESFASVPRLQQALAYEGLSRLAMARSAIDAAISRAPQDWTLELVAHRLALEAGERRAAAEAMQRMLHLNPQIPSTADGG